MKIDFNTTPDVTGLGRIIIDGKFYGLPVEAVELFCALYAFDQIQTHAAVAQLKPISD